MRVALCISGQPRNINRGVQNILENMKFDFEVFVHAWWDSTKNKSTFKKVLYNGVEDEVSELVNNDWVGSLYDNFDINKILIEKQVQLNVPEILEKRKLKFTNTFGVCSGMYSIYKCNELKKEYEKENSFEYDWVIRTRADFGLSEPLNLSQFDNSIVYAPNDNNHNYGFNDQFAIGSSKNMNIYSDTFLYIKETIDSHNAGIKTAHYCDKPDNVGHEQILQKHLENNEIKFELKNFKNYLFRDKDKRTRIHSIED